MDALDIKDAVLTRRFDLRGGGHVDIYVGMPEIATPNGDYTCCYRITGLDGWPDRVRKCYGVDSVQAMQLTLQIIAVYLYTSQSYKSGNLTWLGSRDLNMATFAGERDGGESYAAAELLTSVSDVSIVRLPDTQFAHLAISGQTGRKFLQVLREIKQAKLQDADSRRNMRRLLKILEVHLGYYEAICKQAGIELPYIKIAEA